MSIPFFLALTSFINILVSLTLLNGRLSGWKAVVHVKSLWCPLCFYHTGITVVYHWVLPHNLPPAPPVHFPLPASLLVAICCRDNHRGRSWPYDELTLALTVEAIPADTHRHGHMQEHTLWQGSTDPDTLWHVHTQMWEHTHTSGIRPLCPAVSPHSPGGRLSVVPCPQAIMLHDWFTSSRALCSLVVGCCSVSLRKPCAFKFLHHTWNLQQFHTNLSSERTQRTHKPYTMVPISLFFPLYIFMELIMHIARINPLNLMKCSGGHIPHFLAAFQHVHVLVCVGRCMHTNMGVCAKFLYIKHQTVFSITRAAWVSQTLLPPHTHFLLPRSVGFYKPVCFCLRDL